MMIVLYHLDNTPIGFTHGSNHKSLIQRQETLPVELIGTLRGIL